MAVTDLTGTTWTLNDTPTTTYNELYNINFISNGFDWTKLFLSGVIGYGWAGHSSYGMYHIAYMPAHTVSIPFFANQNYLLYYSETENIDWKSIQLTYSSDKHPDGLSDYQYISLKPNTRYALCPYRTDGRWVAGPAIGHQNDGSDSNFLVVSKFSTSTFNMSDFLSTIKYPNYTSTLTPVSSSYVSNSDTSHSIVTAYTTPSAGFTATEFKTIIITGGTDATNTTLISWLEANATQILPTSFKRYYKNTRLIGTGTYKFRPYTVIQPQLSTPVNVSADGTTVSWDEVENATSYEILADGTSIGEYVPEPSGYDLLIGGHDMYSGGTDTIAYIKFNGVATSTDYDWKAYTENLTSYVKDKIGNDVSFPLELNNITNVNIYLEQGAIDLCSQSFNTIGNHNIVLSTNENTNISMVAYD